MTPAPPLVCSSRQVQAPSEGSQVLQPLHMNMQWSGSGALIGWSYDRYRAPRNLAQLIRSPRRPGVARQGALQTSNFSAFPTPSPVPLSLTIYTHGRIKTYTQISISRRCHDPLANFVKVRCFLWKESHTLQDSDSCLVRLSCVTKKDSEIAEITENSYIKLKQRPIMLDSHPFVLGVFRIRESKCHHTPRMGSYSRVPKIEESLCLFTQPRPVVGLS